MVASIIADPRATILDLLPKGGIGAEIGVWRGDFSARLLQVARPSKLHLIDPWVAVSAETHSGAWYSGGADAQDAMDRTYLHVTQRFKTEMEQGLVEVHRKSSTDALRVFKDRSLDYVYIDGDHTYEGVSADLRDAYRVVKVGGIICGDDYALGKWWRDGVVRALHDFLSGRRIVVMLLLGTQFAVKTL